MDALESFDGFGTLAVPCQPFRRRDFVLCGVDPPKDPRADLGILSFTNRMTDSVK
jgi:hypothetical protein